MTDRGNSSFGGNIQNSMLLHQFVAMKNEVSELKQIIKDRPATSINIDKEGIITKTEFIRGLTKVTKKQSGNNYL